MQRSLLEVALELSPLAEFAAMVEEPDVNHFCVQAIESQFQECPQVGRLRHAGFRCPRAAASVW